jgi:tripartite-type tricarboxylate transporter receptor subunit TctC
MKRWQLLIGLALAYALPAGAQQFPTKSVRLIVPFTAGGSSDILARLIGASLKDAWGQPPIIENKTGASGMLGNDFVAKAAPDGHTLVITDLGTLTIGPSIVKNMLFDLHKDLAPVTAISFSPYMVVVSPKHPIRNLKELIEYSKANPGKLNVATAGIGSNPHLAALQVATALGLQWTFIPSKGGAQALQDVAGGHADLLFNSMLATAPHVKNGNVRLIALTSAKRVGAYPDTPVVSELLPDFTAGSWQGMLTTGGTPRETVARINADVVKILKTAEMTERITGFGADLIANSPEQMDAFLRADRERWAKVIRDSGLKIEQ